MLAVLRQKEAAILTQNGPDEMREYLTKELAHAQFDAHHIVELASKVCAVPRCVYLRAHDVGEFADREGGQVQERVQHVDRR